MSTEVSLSELSQLPDEDEKRVLDLILRSASADHDYTGPDREPGDPLDELVEEARRVSHE